jgi:hypothetical protein
MALSVISLRAKFGSYWTHSGHDATALAGSSPLLNFFGKKNSFPI